MESFISKHPSGANVDSVHRLDAAIRYLQQGRSAQAYAILSQGGYEKEPAAWFAQGLCHIRAGEMAKSVTDFEQALSLLRSAAASHGLAAENTEIYHRLAREQLANQAYLDPMDAEFCRLFPKAAEQNVILALIHSYRQMGMNEQVRRLSSGLTGPIFEDFKRAIEKS